MTTQMNLLPDVPPMGERLIAIANDADTRTTPWLYRWVRCVVCKRWRKETEYTCACGSNVLDLIDPNADADHPEAAQ